MIENMNSKMITNSQVQKLNLKKQKQKQSKQPTRAGTESQKWRSHGGLSAGKGREENERKGTGNKKHKWQVQNRQGELKNSVGNGEAKELLCTTHGHELKGENVGGMGYAGQKGIKWENGTTVIA